MTQVLSTKEVALLVAERIFDNMEDTVLKETAIGWQIDGPYYSVGPATLRVYMNGPMMVIKVNSMDDGGGYTVNMPVLPEDATAERINKHLAYLWCEW